MPSSFEVTQEDIQRAREFYERYKAPEHSLTMRILDGMFGPASRDYLILRKARDYARERHVAATKQG